MMFVVEKGKFGWHIRTATKTDVRNRNTMRTWNDAVAAIVKINRIGKNWRVASNGQTKRA